MKNIKRLFTIIMVILIFAMSCIVVSAESTDDTKNIGNDTKIVSESNTKNDEIVWKYRTYNGVFQKRRWNNTTGSWYDPYWINA